ncbi:hypothetical protein LSTR_LSTR012688 [Laodelphax striatellus]|uniref:PHR domain-containing protein n=1 Tax=Laodelphax striatellus TaxID=195883 RepID=A0A482WMS2_LAOST|nr:hypothetical protein LSTR_LSTR012688 [Laodelphax striatellus]
MRSNDTPRMMTARSIVFTTDRRIYVVGFGLYGSVHGPTEYGVVVQVLKASTGKVCASHATSFVCDGSKATFRAMFEEPVEIMPNTSYIASATLKLPKISKEETTKKYWLE